MRYLVIPSIILARQVSYSFSTLIDGPINATGDLADLINSRIEMAQESIDQGKNDKKIRLANQAYIAFDIDAEQIVTEDINQSSYVSLLELDDGNAYYISSKRHRKTPGLQTNAVDFKLKCWDLSNKNKI